MGKFIQLWFAFFLCALLACNNDDGSKTTENENGDSVNTGSTNQNAVDNADADFLNEAYYGGMKEVEKGKIAQQKGSAKEIKDLGNMMVTDHTAMGEKVKALASKKNVSLPDSLKAEDMDDIRNNKKTGKDFDKDYASDMVDDHEKDIKKFEDAANNSKDADVKALANEALPKLRHHLEMSKAAKDKVKG
jgi:putative membrane protein